MIFWLWFLAGFAAAAVGFWFLYARRRREAHRLDEEKQLLAQEKEIVVEFMHNMVEAIGQGVERHDLYKRVVGAAVLATGALSACVFVRTKEDVLKGGAVEGLFPPLRPLPGDARFRVTTRAKFIEQILKSEEYALGESLIGAVAKSGKAVLITDGENDPRIVHHDDPSLAVRSLIVAPIVFRGRTIGVLAVANPADGMAFNETDFSLVTSLAEQAGLAIHNLDVMELMLEKNRLDMELSLASNIQSMLLPGELPRDNGLEMDARYRPAQKVGGDLYDVITLPEGRFGVVVADVSGKGIPASLLMAICQSNLRHFARWSDSPAEVLRRLNASLMADIRQDMFVTMLYAVLDPANSRLTFARAGHELPLLLRPSGEGGLPQALQPGSNGMALGMVPADIFDPVIEDKTMEFAPGDVLVLYTDGITEAPNADGQEFSTRRLIDAVLAVVDRPAFDLNGAILDAVHRFQGETTPVDDMTLFTCKRT